MSKSTDEQLESALRENVELKKSLAESMAGQRKAEEELESCAHALATAEKELQDFLYAAAHDLKQTLRVISVYTELLQRQYAQDKQATEFTSFIVDGVTEMRTLIESLLTFSRMSAPGRRTTVSLSAVVQWALLNVEASARESGAQITYAELPEVVVDESQMVQVFQNLLSNALKFRREEPPRISVSSEAEPGAYTISVRDNGVGIESQYRDQIFTPFKRLHGREVPGTGLGLALCKRIIEGHGGRIWVESDGRTGSTFKFTLPV